MRAVFRVFYLCFLFFAGSMQSAFVTYELSGGRFGDNLVSYLHAKWISFKYNIPLIYYPFEYSDQLVMHQVERTMSPIRGWFLDHLFLTSGTKWINPYRYCLYHVPYFGEDKTEFRTNSHWIYFEVDWNNADFKKQITHLIQPLNRTILDAVQLPKDCTTVAVHMRRGGGYDSPLLEDSMYKLGEIYADIFFPLKFVPYSFYVDHIKKLSELLNHADMYVHIFTDDKQPELIVKRLEHDLSAYKVLLFS